MPKRKTQEEFVKEIKNLYTNEYSVIGKYINSKTKILVKHNVCGKEFLSIPSDFLNGHGCAKCARAKAFKKRTKTTKQFKKEVYDLVGNKYSVVSEYITCMDYINMIHNECGNQYKVIPNSFLKGSRCPICSNKNLPQRTPKTNDRFKKEVYELVGEEYIFLEDYKTSLDKILVRHNTCQYEYYVSPASFLGGTRCPKCQHSLTWSTNDMVRWLSENLGEEYSLNGEYINSKIPLNLTHNKCGKIFYATQNNFVGKGTRCPYCCLKGKSKSELEIFKWVESIYDGKVSRYRDSNYEIDIYIPDKKVGIEYNGNYWHSEIKKSKTYHIDKTKYFYDKGIRIIHIFEYEWDDEIKRSIIENIIKDSFDIKENIICAEECTIEVCDPKITKDFFNKNNIHGFKNGKFSICLIYKKEIVMSYIIDDNYLEKEEHVLEIVREATKLGTNIVGGTQSLFTYLIKNNKFNKIIFYCDICKSTGDVYKELGFILEHNTKPTYTWVRPNNPVKIYNCGNYKFTYKQV